MRKIKIEYWRELNLINIKDIYSVSNYGRVMNNITNKYLKPYLDKKGYVRYGLKTIDSNTRIFGAHQLVMVTFNPPTNYDLIINHKDCDKTNNYIKNLEWCTIQYNNSHALENNRIINGENKSHAKSTNNFIINVCELMSLGYKNKNIAKVLDVEYTNYYKNLFTKIRQRKKWKNISKNYIW